MDTNNEYAGSMEKEDVCTALSLMHGRTFTLQIKINDESLIGEGKIGKEVDVNIIPLDHIIHRYNKARKILLAEEVKRKGQVVTCVGINYCER